MPAQYGGMKGFAVPIQEARQCYVETMWPCAGRQRSTHLVNQCYNEFHRLSGPACRTREWASGLGADRSRQVDGDDVDPVHADVGAEKEDTAAGDFNDDPGAPDLGFCFVARCRLTFPRQTSIDKVLYQSPRCRAGQIEFTGQGCAS